jgi:ABC-type glycerol-3-phosphate transport system permease component
MVIRLVFTKERPFREKLHATNEINTSFLVPIPYSLLSIVRLRKTNAFGEITHVQTKLELEKCDFWSLVLLLLGAFIVLLPLIMVFLTSFAPTGTTPGVMGKNNSTLANYREAWERGKFLLTFANSTLVAIAVTASQIMTSALAGYALARLKFLGRQALLLVVLATLVIPFQLLVIPTFWY